MAAERAIVVGAGAISNSWFPALLEEQVEIAAVVDLRREAAEQQIARYGVQAEALTGLGEALQRHRPDFVVDLTVPEAHCPVTCAALRSGCHVIGEKPMAASLAQARKMVRTAEETGRMYMVSQCRRWDPRHDQVRRLAHGGELGALTTVNCDYYMGPHLGGFRDEMPSPLLLDMAIHHFDLARYFTGVDAEAVYAVEYNPSGSWYRGAAAASVIFEMSGGIVFTYRGSWCAEGHPTSWNGHWRIVGERGSLLYEQDQPPVTQVVAVGEGGQRPVQDLPPPPPQMPYPEMRGALREMLVYLREGVVPQTECHDNLQSLAMVFVALDSSAQGRRLPVQIW